MHSFDDTIVAIATPAGQGGIGIVRLSGPGALGIARRIFRGRAERLAPNSLCHGHVVAPGTRRVVDEVLLSFMQAPHSYTRQDVVEINGHGGIVPLQEILSLCLEAGARLAQPGEFTMRAFLSGRIDLAQAEAVADVVQAQTEVALQVAMEQLGGRLSARLREARRELLRTLAYLEANIDFPEEDLPAQQLDVELLRIGEQLQALLAEAERGIIYRQGVRVVILGRPNVGKSSLLNTLLRYERAIVTPIPGTTRDTLEETLNLRGVPLVLVDTAGIAETDNPIEHLGIARSRAQAERADAFLCVVDGSKPLSQEDLTAAELARQRTAIVVVNKIDLADAGEDHRAECAQLLPQAPHVCVSATTGAGMRTLEELLVRTILAGTVAASTVPVSSNPRHRDLLRRARERIAEANGALATGLPAEVVAVEVAEAVNALGEITGETASEDLLASIFANFCIGK